MLKRNQSLIDLTKEGDIDGIKNVLYPKGWYFTGEWIDPLKFEYVDLNGMNAFWWAIEKDHYQILTLLLGFFERISSEDLGVGLLKACRGGKFNSIQVLLEYGADPNFTLDDECPLLVTFRPSFVTTITDHNSTEEVYHINDESVKICQLLIDNGANPHTKLRSGQCVIDIARDFRGYSDSKVVDILSTISPPLPPR